MRSKTPRQALIDIRDNIDLALSFVEGWTRDQFLTDRRTLYAVIRCLEIISEASRRVAEELKKDRPDIEWADIAAAGNIYRHEYEDVLPDMVWQTVKTRLEPLRQAVIAALGPED